MSWFCVLCCAHVMVLCFVLCTCHGFEFCEFCAVYKALFMSKLCALCFGCYALLRMRPLLNSWAECSVVIFCGKVDYDKSG
jgi:hypothetical protein